MSRIDPASMPPAGRPLHHDSSNEDYRFTLAHDAGSPHRKLQTCQWASPSEEHARKVRHIRPEPPPPAQPPARPRPDLQHTTADVEGAGPLHQPGITLHSNSTGVPYVGAPSPSRCRVTNPLAPAYHLPGASASSSASAPCSPAGPASPAGSGAGCCNSPGAGAAGSRIQALPLILQRQHSGAAQGGAGSPSNLGSPSGGGAGARRHSGLDVSDIPGAAAAPSTHARLRGPAHDPLQYADVSAAPLSPVKAHLAREGRPHLPPVDSHPLGMWGTSGDTGRLVASHREPIDPVNPTYKLYGTTHAAPNPKIIRHEKPPSYAAVAAAPPPPTMPLPPYASDVPAPAGGGGYGAGAAASGGSFRLGHNIALVHQLRPGEVTHAPQPAAGQQQQQRERKARR